MKLFELVGVKKFADADLESVLKSMQKTGYKEAGRGSFGVVLKGSKPGVVKFWIKDSSYDDFIDYIQKHPSKYFPKLLSKPKELTTFFASPEKFPAKIRFVRMEELDSMHEELAISYTVEDVMKKIRDYPDSSSEEIIDSLHTRRLDALQELVGMSNVHTFVEDMQQMIKAIVKGSNRLDIHAGNIMKRSNGDLVITDPIYNVKDKESSEDIEDALEKLKQEKSGGSKPK